MASSKVALANLALRRIGAQRISSFDDPTPEARIVKDVYDDCRDGVLCEGIWGFAQSPPTALVQLTPPAGWIPYDGANIFYQVPTDFLKLNFYSDPNAIVLVNSYNGATVIRSDTSGIQIVYTMRNDNPATYFQNFTNAFVGKLASDIGFNLTQATKKAIALLEEYTKILLPKALDSDAQQGTAMEMRQDEWENARRMNGAGIVGRPGQQTWTPINPW